MLLLGQCLWQMGEDLWRDHGLARDWEVVEGAFQLFKVRLAAKATAGIGITKAVVVGGAEIHFGGERHQGLGRADQLNACNIAGPLDDAFREEIAVYEGLVGTRRTHGNGQINGFILLRIIDADTQGPFGRDGIIGEAAPLPVFPAEGGF